MDAAALASVAASRSCRASCGDSCQLQRPVPAARRSRRPPACSSNAICAAFGCDESDAATSQPPPPRSSSTSLPVARRIAATHGSAHRVVLSCSSAAAPAAVTWRMRPLDAAALLAVPDAPPVTTLCAVCKVRRLRASCRLSPSTRARCLPQINAGAGRGPPPFAQRASLRLTRVACAAGRCCTPLARAARGSCCGSQSPRLAAVAPPPPTTTATRREQEQLQQSPPLARPPVHLVHRLQFRSLRQRSCRSCASGPQSVVVAALRLGTHRSQPAQVQQTRLGQNS